MKAVRALVFRQKDVQLYCFTMNAMDLEPLCYVEAATRGREKGIQRVTEVSRLREIGEFLATGENSFLPNNIILNLKPEVKVSEDDGKMATLTFPSEAGDYAFVVDGQHRIFSFRDEYRQLSETETCLNYWSFVSTTPLKKLWGQHSFQSMSTRSRSIVTS